MIKNMIKNNKIFKVIKEFTNLQVILLCFKTKYDLTSSLVRMQEFYESDSSKFRGKYFDLDTYMDWYSKKHDNIFSYFEDWSGFNLPDYSIKEFEKLFKNKLRVKEEIVLNAINKNLENNNTPYYVIAYQENDYFTLKHEISHALFYLNDDYRNKAINLISELPSDIYDGLIKFLKYKKYDSSVFDDEICAYMLSEIDFFQNTIKNITKYQENFIKLYDTYIKNYGVTYET
jgi:hypothetical protein